MTIRTSRDAEAWYAVKCLPRREALAADQLTRQGFRIFFPVRKEFASGRSGPRATLVAFFPSYLFVALDLEADRWRSVNGTVGVVGLVQFGPRPSRVPPDFIEYLALRTSADGAVRMEHEYNPGDVVEIRGGVLHRSNAIFSRMLEGDRVEVLLSLMSRSIPVSVHVEALAPAS